MRKPRKKHVLRFPAGRYQLKNVLAFIPIIILMLVLLNTYPILESQNLIFTAKEAGLTARAGLIASTLAGLDILSQNEVEYSMGILGNQEVSRILVTNADGLVVFDNAKSENVLGKFAMQTEIFRALAYGDVFTSRYAEGAFESRAATPVVSGGHLLGAVCLYEYDAEQASILQSLQNNISSISVVIAVVVVTLSVIISSALSRRLGELLRGIQLVREGEYSHRVPMRGRDELADLADEFNELTGRLQKTEAARRRFVSDASHELKTPLASIRLLTDSILQTENIDKITIREFVADIGDESDRLSRLTEKLLALTRMDAEVAETVCAQNIKTVVQRAVSRLEPLSAHYGISIELHMDDVAEVDANEDGLYQIVFNLIENAIKYNQPGGTIQVFLFQREDLVKLIVKDSGVGVPADELPRVFERFYRVDKARSREAGGAGLGLSIVKDKLQQYGGNIVLDSTPGQGTRVTVTFRPSSNG